MLTVSAMSGIWEARVVNSLTFGGGAWGLYYSNFSVIWAVPSSGGTRPSVSIKGYIQDGPLNPVGDRDCTHFDADGEIWFLGAKATVTQINPVHSTYVGPPIRLDQYVFRYEGMRSFTAAGVVISELRPFTVNFPDHMIGPNAFRNCVVHFEVDGNRMRRVSQYQQKPSGTTIWVDMVDIGNWVEFDFELARFRDVGYSRWTYAYRLTSVAPVNLPAIANFKSRDWLSAFNRASKDYEPLDELFIWGDLCRRCANDAQALDLNSIEYLAELPALIPDLKRVLQLLRGKATLKTASKLFLSYQYGARLTVSDTMEIIKSIPRRVNSLPHFRWVRATESVTPAGGSLIVSNRKDLFNYKVYYDPRPSEISQFANDLWSVGLFPSLKNSWDLIPMSFVVDWFVDVSNRLNSFDARTFWSTCRVLNTVLSHKTVLEGVNADELFSRIGHCSGRITMTRYTRWTSPTLVKPTFFSDTPREFKNYAEAAALLISRKAKR